MKLYYVPVSTYCQKVLMAFHEKGVAFEPELVNLSDETARSEYRKFYPLGKVSVLVPEEDWMIPESSIIIEYLDTHFDAGTRLLPDDPDLARQARFKDRMLDLYLNDSISNLFFQGRKPQEERDPALIERCQYRPRLADVRTRLALVVRLMRSLKRWFRLIRRPCLSKPVFSMIPLSFFQVPEMKYCVSSLPPEMLADVSYETSFWPARRSSTSAVKIGEPSALKKSLAFAAVT